jgi:ABC-type glycerol-3-phosphate transport system substrate-binding protein
MYDVTINKTLIALSAVALVVAGCGGSTSSSNGSSSSASSGAPGASGAPSFSDVQAPPSQLVIEATIAHGAVTPTNQQLQAKVNEVIIVKIDSDAADELHAHSTPDHTFKVEAKPNQSFQFTPSVPGKVEIELHDLNRVIATVDVQ